MGNDKGHDAQPKIAGNTTAVSTECSIVSGVILDSTPISASSSASPTTLINSFVNTNDARETGSGSDASLAVLSSSTNNQTSKTIHSPLHQQADECQEVINTNTNKHDRGSTSNAIINPDLDPDTVTEIGFNMQLAPNSGKRENELVLCVTEEAEPTEETVGNLPADANTNTNEMNIDSIADAHPDHTVSGADGMITCSPDMNRTPLIEPATPHQNSNILSTNHEPSTMDVTCPSAIATSIVADHIVNANPTSTALATPNNSNGHPVSMLTLVLQPNSSNSGIPETSTALASDSSVDIAKLTPPNAQTSTETAHPTHLTTNSISSGTTAMITTNVNHNDMLVNSPSSIPSDIHSHSIKHLTKVENVVTGRRKRKRLTVKQKVDVLRRLDKGERQSVLAAEYGCSKRALARLKQERATFTDLDLNEVDANRKSRHSVKHIILENKLSHFLRLAKRNGFPISGNSIRKAALKFRDDLLKDPNLPWSERPSLLSFQASINWSKGFLRRCCIRTIDHPNSTGNIEEIINGDGDNVGNANTSTNNGGHQRLSDIASKFHKKLEQFDMDCIFAFDRTMLFYKLLPNEPVLSPSYLSAHNISIPPNMELQTDSQNCTPVTLHPSNCAIDDLAKITSNVPSCTNLDEKIDNKVFVTSRPTVNAGTSHDGSSISNTAFAANIIKMKNVNGSTSHKLSSTMSPNPPTSTTNPQTLSDRVNLMLATNVTGSIKISPMMVLSDDNKELTYHNADNGQASGEIKSDATQAKVVFKLPYLTHPHGLINDTIFRSWLFCIVIPTVRRITTKRIAILLSHEWASSIDANTLPDPQVEVIAIPKELLADKFNPFGVGINSMFRHILRYSLLGNIINLKHGEVSSNAIKECLNLRAFAESVHKAWFSLSFNFIHKCWIKSRILPPTMVLKLTTDHCGKTQNTDSGITDNDKEHQFFICSSSDQVISSRVIQDMVANRRLTVSNDTTYPLICTNSVRVATVTDTIKTASDSAAKTNCEESGAVNLIDVFEQRAKALVHSLHESGRRGVDAWVDVETCARSHRALGIELDRIISNYKSPIICQSGDLVPSKRKAFSSLGLNCSSPLQPRQKQPRHAQKNWQVTSSLEEDQPQPNRGGISGAIKPNSSIPPPAKLLALLAPIQKIVDGSASETAASLLRNLQHELLKLKSEESEG